jgi:hypothetical protein
VAEARDPELEEDDVASGVLRLRVAGSVRLVPELKWRENRKWTARMREVFASLAGVPDDTPDGVERLADAQRGLILEYDATHALGDLDDATERELDAIYQRMVTVAFPLASSPATAMLMVAREVVQAALDAAAASAPPSSTSSPSPSGATGTGRTSRPASPSGRSASTTPRRRSASSGRPASG